jgi:membrane-bound lytic murein transglycosylase B
MGAFASLIVRVNSKVSPHARQRYSYRGMGYRVCAAIGNTRRVASNDLPPLIRQSVPSQRTSTQVSLVKRRSGAVAPVSLVKRVSLAKRRVRVSLAKTRPVAPARPSAPPRRRALLSPTRTFAAVSTGATRGAQATREWATKPSGRMALPGLLMAALVALALVGGSLLPSATDAPAASGPESSGLPSEGQDVPDLPDDGDPTGPLLPSDNPPASLPPGQQPADVLAAWASPMAVRTAIPVVALEAYALAELKVAQTAPNCGLRWTTLAGIGRTESNHGRSNNATLTTDGRSTPPIYGPLLDGTGGRQSIPDTDQGRLDGDSTWDRAVGPMQFIPSTWTRYAVDADGSGTPDPHDIHDAALAAGNYLCAGGRNLATAEDWWAAVLAYNNVQTYAQNVYNAANDYGLRSRT